MGDVREEDDLSARLREEEWWPPARPICPVLPGPFLAWWGHVHGVPVLSLAEYAVTWGITPVEADRALRFRARCVRRLQWHLNEQERRG